MGVGQRHSAAVCGRRTMVRLVRISLWVLILATVILLAACTPHPDVRWDQNWGVSSGMTPVLTPRPALTSDAFVTDDGLSLRLRSWVPQGTPQGVIVAVHGFNDNADAFAGAGALWASQGLATYTYDKRGFGASPGRSHWAGEEAMVNDLLTMVELVRARWPGLPLVVVGESMGGALTLITADHAQRAGHDLADGLVLAAPAVWARSTMPWSYRMALAVMIRVAPSLQLSGGGLKISPTDNMEMLYDWSRDPLVIHKSRVETLWGLTNVMDHAYAVAMSGRLSLPILWLYGEHDELVPPKPTLEAAGAALDPSRNQRFVLYGNGWHMLLRDLQGDIVLADIAAFVRDRAGALPFGPVRDPKDLP